MDSKFDSRLIRLKGMRRLCLRREERTLSRQKTTKDLRKEKRLNIVNSFRGLDFEWFYVDFKDDSDWNISYKIGKSHSNSIQELVDYIFCSINTSEKIAKNYIEEVKQLLNDNRDNCEELIKVEFFQRLSGIVANPVISSTLKVSILELIQSIMSCMAINDYILINSGIILSVMITFDHFDIELVTKAVNVMQVIANFSEQMQRMALENGYLLFLLKIIETTRVTKRKTKLSETINELKLGLIRAISESLLSLALHLTNTDVIINVYPLLKKLIVLKDRRVIVNTMTAFTLITNRNPEYIVYIDFAFIQSITDLINRCEDDIVLSSIQIWTNFIINETRYSSLVTQTKLLANIRTLLESSSSNPVMKEIANFLSIFLEINTTFAVNLLIESGIIPLLIKAMLSVEYFSKQQLLSTIIKIVNSTETSDTLIYLLESGLIESLPPLLELEETNLTIASLDAYTCILSIAQKLGQIYLVVFKGYWSYLYEWLNYYERHQNACIATKATYIQTQFSTPKHLNIPQF